MGSKLQAINPKSKAYWEGSFETDLDCDNSFLFYSSDEYS